MWHQWEPFHQRSQTKILFRYSIFNLSSLKASTTNISLNFSTVMKRWRIQLYTRAQTTRATFLALAMEEYSWFQCFRRLTRKCIPCLWLTLITAVPSQSFSSHITQPGKQGHIPLQLRDRVRILRDPRIYLRMVVIWLVSQKMGQ